jgi:hypothetical protein
MNTELLPKIRKRITTVETEQVGRKLCNNGYRAYVDDNIIITNAFPTDIEEMFVCVHKIPGALFIKIQSEVIEIRSIV